jgi:nicotinamide-nucleotide amidase
MSLRAEVLAIGDEFVHGQKVDTNSAWLALELGLLGFQVERLTVVSDAEEELADAVRAACDRADVVIATGGLGPTDDDRTRAAAARVVGEELEFDADAWRSIEAMFRVYTRATGRTPPPSNKRQATFPRGATVLQNRWGTAPGFSLPVGDATFYALPGVPREMRAMWETVLKPRIESAGGEPMTHHCMQVIGCREAELGEMLSEFMDEGQETKVGITASGGQLTVRIASFEETALQTTVERLRPLLGEWLVYEGGHSLAEEVGRRLIESEVTVAVAESCTGGLLAGALTDVVGISEVFLAGFVTYSNDAKIRDLGVPEDLIATHGAVSVEVVAAMAAGAAAKTGARATMAISGIAGPGGGTEEHPVGTVCFAVCLDGETTAAERRFGDLGRELLRQRSVREALLHLHRALP